MTNRTAASPRLLSAIIAVALISTTVTHASAPKDRYAINVNDGTVFDTKTKLTWQGMVATDTMTWDAARTHCTSLVAASPGTGWRLPTVKELSTIVDHSTRDPAIDLDAFPNTLPGAFWTSTQVILPGAQSRWIVDFGLGSVRKDAPMNLNQVRCVR